MLITALRDTEKLQLHSIVSFLSCFAFTPMLYLSRVGSLYKSSPTYSGKKEERDKVKSLVFVHILRGEAWPKVYRA